MDSIGIPLPPSVSFTPGFEGFPAYNFGSEANVGRLTRTFVPGPFFRDFAIIVTVLLIRTQDIFEYLLCWHWIDSS